MIESKSPEVLLSHRFVSGCVCMFVCLYVYINVQGPSKSMASRIYLVIQFPRPMAIITELDVRSKHHHRHDAAILLPFSFYRMPIDRPSCSFAIFFFIYIFILCSVLFFSSIFIVLDIFFNSFFSEMN